MEHFWANSLILTTTWSHHPTPTPCQPWSNSCHHSDRPAIEDRPRLEPSPSARINHSPHLGRWDWYRESKRERKREWKRERKRRRMGPNCQEADVKAKLSDQSYRQAANPNQDCQADDRQFSRDRTRTTPKMVHGRKKRKKTNCVGWLCTTIVTSQVLFNFWKKNRPVYKSFLGSKQI